MEGLIGFILIVCIVVGVVVWRKPDTAQRIVTKLQKWRSK